MEYALHVYPTWKTNNKAQRGMPIILPWKISNTEWDTTMYRFNNIIGGLIPDVIKVLRIPLYDKQEKKPCGYNQFYFN